MSKTEATQAQADTIAAGDCAAEDGYFTIEASRARRTANAQKKIADPMGSFRDEAEYEVRARRERVDGLTADRRVAVLELKAAEARLLALGPVPVVDEAPAAKKAAAKVASLKAAAKASGRKHVE